MRAGLAGSVGTKPGDNPGLWGLSRVQSKLGLEVKEVLWSWTRPGDQDQDQDHRTKTRTRVRVRVHVGLVGLGLGLVRVRG